MASFSNKAKVCTACCSSKSSSVLPFDDKADETLDKQLMFGPYNMGCFQLEVYGPVQLLFWACSLGGLILLFIEIDKQSEEDTTDIIRYITALACLVSTLFLGWAAKAFYILKLIRIEIVNFRKLNKALQTQVEDLTEQVAAFEKENEKYKSENSRHEELNKNLKEQVARHEEENNRQGELNAQLTNEVTGLKATVSDLSHVEKQLEHLNKEFSGSIEQARHFLDRLERNIKLDTVNTVYLFFDRCDRNKDGVIDKDEMDLFMNSVSKLFEKVKGFDKDQMKASMLEQGGLTLDQAHTLVEAVLLEDSKDKSGEKLAKSFSSSGKLDSILTEMNSNEKA